MTRTWSKASKAFHWIGAAFIFYLLIHGFWMVGLPRELRFSHYETHAAAGYLFIALTLARLVWRWTHAVPAQPPGAARWEVIAAHAGHWGLYAFMLAAEGLIEVNGRSIRVPDIARLRGGVPAS